MNQYSYQKDTSLLKACLVLPTYNEAENIESIIEAIFLNQSIIEKLLPYKNSINKWAVLIGPEGGFSNHENKLLSENNDIVSVSLGDKVLRSDTAITVSLFIIQQLLV